MRFTIVPVAVLSAGSGAERSVRLELQRGAVRVLVHWPLAAAPECAGWLRDWPM